MKKIYLTFLIAAFASATWAQDTPKKPSFTGFVSNGFWDNWEISVGAGAGTAFSNGSNLKSFGDRIGFEGNFSLTKWVHPVVGLRAQLQGGWFNNYDPEKGKMDWPYMFVHTDVMLNVSNWIGGYREDRAWYAVPFVGFGYMASNFTDKSQRDFGASTNQELAFTYGLLSKFRLSPAFDFNIELKGLLAKSELCPAQMNGQYLLGFSATAGLTYRFNKRNWQRGVPGYTAADIQAFQDAVAASMAAAAALEAQNAQLAQQLEDAEAKAAAADAAAKAAAAKAAADAAAAARNANTLSPYSIVFYDYGMSKLTSKDKTRLELMADVIKDGPKDRVYTIVGHADQQTGTAAGNRRVADNRAKNVYDYLVKCGVNPKQLTYEGKGNEPDIYKSNQKANRAVIVK
ncbi:MAG: OmpA family protein [Alistipes senegalensis]|uniref:OmpA family protein n=1 Tax=Alistipes senegalensis TaxID=1288121 RepID=UPI00189A16B3|nr:OmpA family protein [Alistipes senegalensis]MBD9301981.1 OmpA family protein [Alistipes senegalensis]